MSTTLNQQINLQQSGSHSYTASHHVDWSIGPTLHGGCVAAVIHRAAATHFATTFKGYDQPDVHTLQINFLRYCVLGDLDITVIDLKRGPAVCTIQLQLAQDGIVKVIALATSTNFTVSLGPSADTDWALKPTPQPIPDFTKSRRISVKKVGSVPRGGYPIAGVCDGWNRFKGSETMDSSCVALLCDMIPSLSDTLLRNGGLYDAHKNYALVEEWAEANPGVLGQLTNTFAEAARANCFNTTVTMIMEFKKRLPDEGIEWVFTRAATRRLQDGRMDLDVTICDQQMEPVCISRQAILVLDAKRRFNDKKPKASL